LTVKEDKVNVVEKVMRTLENNPRPFVEEEVYGLLKTGKVPVGTGHL
jgi:rRNA-processing protein FCF1